MRKSFRNFCEAKGDALAIHPDFVSQKRKPEILEPELEEIPDHGAPVPFNPHEMSKSTNWLVNKLDLLRHSDGSEQGWAKTKYEQIKHLAGKNDARMPMSNGFRELAELDRKANEGLMRFIDSYLAAIYDRNDPNFQVLRSKDSDNLTFWIENLMKVRESKGMMELKNMIPVVFQELKSGDLHHPKISPNYGKGAKTNLNNYRSTPPKPGFNIDRNLKSQEFDQSQLNKIDKLRRAGLEDREILNKIKQPQIGSHFKLGGKKVDLSPEVQNQVNQLRNTYDDEKIADMLGIPLRDIRNVQ